MSMHEPPCIALDAVILLSQTFLDHQLLLLLRALAWLHHGTNRGSRISLLAV